MQLASEARRRALASMSEREFQAQMRQLAELKGWIVLTTWNSMHSPAGEPDLRLVRPPRVIFMELKSQKGKLSPAQEQVIALLKRCPGLEVYVFRPSDFEQIIKVLGRE